MSTTPSGYDQIIDFLSATVPLVVYKVLEVLLGLIPRTAETLRANRFASNEGSLILCKDHERCQHNPANVPTEEHFWYCKYLHPSQLHAIIDGLKIASHLTGFEKPKLVIIHAPGVNGPRLFPALVTNPNFEDMNVIPYTHIDRNSAMDSLKLCMKFSGYFMKNPLISSYLLSNIIFPRPVHFQGPTDSAKNFGALTQHAYENLMELYSKRAHGMKFTKRIEENFSKFCHYTIAEQYRFDEFAQTAQENTGAEIAHTEIEESGGKKQSEGAGAYLDEFEPSVPAHLINKA